MSKPDNAPDTGDPQQRGALAESEKAANRSQPRNWKEDAVQDKIVEIEPEKPGGSPIQGIDPKADRPSK